MAITAVGAVMETINMAYVLPAAKCDLNITMWEQGFLLSMSFYGCVLTAFFWGYLSDIWGRKKVLLLAIQCLCVLSTISSMSYSSTMLLVTRGMIGLL